MVILLLKKTQIVQSEGVKLDNRRGLGAGERNKKKYSMETRFFLFDLLNTINIYVIALFSKYKTKNNLPLFQLK